MLKIKSVFDCNFRICILLIFFSIIVSPTNQLFAQFDTGQKIKGSSEPSTVGGLGIKLSYIMPDLKEVNESVSDFGLTELNDAFLTYGGQLFGELAPGISLGVNYNYGFTETSGVVVYEIEEDEFINLNRKVEYNINYGGLLFQINRPLNRSVSLFSDISANYGSVNLLVSQSGGNQSFSGMWHSFDPNSSISQYNRSIHYETDLYLFEATGGVKYTFKEGLGVVLSTGYIYSFAGTEGSVNYGFSNIFNVPDFSIKTMSYTLMIIFGG